MVTSSWEDEDAGPTAVLLHQGTASKPVINEVNTYKDFFLAKNLIKVLGKKNIAS